MKVELFNTGHVEFGEKVEVIGLCSKVEIKQNLSTTGSYREVYHIAGKDGAFITGIIFKENSLQRVEPLDFEDQPIYVTGTIGEYRDVLQIHIESITPLGDKLDKDDLLAEMASTEILDEINDILYEQGSHYQFSLRHLKPAKGLVDTGAGTMAERILRLLQVGVRMYPEQTSQFVSAISGLTELYLATEATLEDKINYVSKQNTNLTRALLFNDKECPELEEFVKLHHLIMKPRGYVLEILDTNHFGYCNGCGDN